jgi:hypothetical protein
MTNSLVPLGTMRSFRGVCPPFKQPKIVDEFAKRLPRSIRQIEHKTLKLKARDGLEIPCLCDIMSDFNVQFRHCNFTEAVTFASIPLSYISEGMLQGTKDWHQTPWSVALPSRHPIAQGLLQ